MAGRGRAGTRPYFMADAEGGHAAQRLYFIRRGDGEFASVRLPGPGCGSSSGVPWSPAMLHRGCPDPVLRIVRNVRPSGIRTREPKGRQGNIAPPRRGAGAPCPPMRRTPEQTSRGAMRQQGQEGQTWMVIPGAASGVLTAPAPSTAPPSTTSTATPPYRHPHPHPGRAGTGRARPDRGLEGAHPG